MAGDSLPLKKLRCQSVGLESEILIVTRCARQLGNTRSYPQRVTRNWNDKAGKLRQRDRAMTVRMTREFSFDAAHRLPRVPAGHRCGQVHGHTFKVEVHYSGEVDPDTGWIGDHREVAAAVRELTARLDHQLLNDIEGLENPTVETLCGWFWAQLQPAVPGLEEIVVHETPSARCAYRG